MVKKWIFTLRLLSKKLSIRAAIYAIFAVISSLVAVVFDTYVPDEFSDLIGGFSVDKILTMLGNSMLIVTTFALSTMVAAYSSATQSATPRATNLIMEDSYSHSAISVFLGAFIFSVVSLIALSTEYYGKKGRVILLGITILVLIAVVVMIIRWVGELKNMGQARESIRRVEKVTSKAFSTRAKMPTFGCELFENLPSEGSHISADEVGYIQNIDIASLDEVAKENDCRIYINNDVGAFVHPKSSLAFMDVGRINDDLKHKVQNCFSIGKERTFENDPRYGVAVLAGIGLKALSPSVNDPGTAIDVIGALVRVLIKWDKGKDAKEEVKYKRLFFPSLKVKDIFNDAFYSVTISGIDHVEVIKSLQLALNALKETNNTDFREAAIEHIGILSDRAKHKFSLNIDLKNIFSDHMIGENQRHPVQPH